MILITGAAGKTGQAVLKAVLSLEEDVRVFVRQEAQAAELRTLGAWDAVIGDLTDGAALRSAFSGVRAVYHICPNMSPYEVSIGQSAIDSARQAGVEHFVYHSVLHPQVQEMAHHWNKLQVEALLFQSGLNYTTLQPASYMQNIAGYWKKMQADGIYAVPYSTRAAFSMVDLDDLAQVAALVIRQGAAHYRATYEVCGAQLLSSAQVAELAGAVLQRSIQAIELDQGEWERNARAAGMDDFARTTLLAMFAYYHRHGFSGNATALTALLGRPPATFEEFLQRFASTTHPN